MQNNNRIYVAVYDINNSQAPESGRDAKIGHELGEDAQWGRLYMETVYCQAL